MSQLTMFVVNIKLLIGILTCAGLALILGVVLYTTLRATHAARKSQKGLAAFEKSRRDAQGRPLPPVGMGVCANCGLAATHVHFLPDGTRLCRDCLDNHGTNG